MPLIIITGLPSSGKTHRAQQIHADFQSRASNASFAPSSIVPHNLTVQNLPSHHASLDSPHVSSQDVGPLSSQTNPRDLIYNSAREEKTARAEEFSAVKRALSKNTLVIADAPNYIKGFRYQMWCEAKAVGTRSVVIHAAALEDQCKTWNEERIRAWGWDEELMTDAQGETHTTGSKVGSNVRGDLQPESHTAIYGDRSFNETVKEGTRSRSSSMGGNSSDGDESGFKRDPVETMTLKSLYISNGQLDTEAIGSHRTNGDTSHSNSLGSQDTAAKAPATTASAEPPTALASLPYKPATFESLAMRYEPPSPFTRWDTPLFTVPSSDVHPPYQAIWDAIFPQPTKLTKKVISQLRPGEEMETKPEEVRRHAATVLPKATGAEALQTLETATGDVIKALLATARERGAADGEGGDLTISIPDPKSGSIIEAAIEIPLNTMLSQPALQRLRRKYTQMQRGGIAHGLGHVSGRAEVVRDFCRFLQAEWNAE